jgi:sulfur-carrier protein adenylyltransferase/sulfurtransferase
VAAADQTNALEVDPARLAGWLGENPAPQVIDVRERYEREAGHIAGTAHIELTELSGQAVSVQQEPPVVFYCRTGSRSLMAAQAFRASGYEAYSLDGGLVRWVAEGHPLSPPDGYVADH